MLETDRNPVFVNEIYFVNKIYFEGNILKTQEIQVPGILKDISLSDTYSKLGEVSWEIFNTFLLIMFSYYCMIDDYN